MHDALMKKVATSQATRIAFLAVFAIFAAVSWHAVNAPSEPDIQAADPNATPSAKDAIAAASAAKTAQSPPLQNETERRNAPNKVEDAKRHGLILADETWAGTVQVTGDVVVPNGVTLTIEPGTVVLVAANSDEQNLMTAEPFWLKEGIAAKTDRYIHEGEPYRDESKHVTIWVDGTLDALGTKEKPIVFKSDAPMPSRYDWNTLNVGRGQIKHALVRDFRAMNLKTGVILSDSEVFNVGECPICIHDSQDVTVLRNWVHDSGHEVVDLKNSFATLKDNRFGPSPRFVNPGGGKAGWGGIIVGHDADAVFENNTVEGFDDGITFFERATYEKRKDKYLAENTFKNNTEDVAYHNVPPM